MKRVIVRCFAVAAFLGVSLVAQTRAQAGLTVFTDLLSYENATTGNTLIDFEGIAPDNDFVFYLPPTTTISGVTFSIDTSKSDGGLFVIGKGFSGFYPNTSVLSSENSSTSENNILITLPGSYTAASMNLGSFFGGTAMVTTSNGNTYDVTIPGSTAFAFTGFTSTAPITSISVEYPTAGGDPVLNLDNFRFGAASVPEPSSLALAFCGAFGVGLLVWRRRRRTA
jgi:hypothetical protein